MFTPITRIILFVFSIIAAIYFYSKEDFLSMSMTLIAGGLFVYGYFKYGTVYAAFQQIKKKNITKADELISKIKNPEKLTNGHKSYYYFITGIIALEKKELEKSHSHLNKALNIGLRTENDKSIVLVNLANMELLRKNYDKTVEYIKRARELDLKPLVKTETNRIEKEVNIAKQKP